MPLTRDFRLTIQQRVKRSATFRRELLRQAVECLVSGDLETGKDVLRDYINATVGFGKLGEVTGRSPKSLMRMFGPGGNPQARNLLDVVAYLQQQERVKLTVKSAKVRTARAVA
jgi:hypothetical protein